MPRAIKTCFALILLTGAACGEEGDDDSSSSVLPATQQVTAGSAAPPTSFPSSQPSATTVPVTPVTPTSATLIVENRFVSQSIWGVYLSPSNDDDWGPEQLGGKILSPGEKLTLRQIPCNLHYDLKITGERSSKIAIVEEIPFPCGVEKVVTLGE